MPRSTNKKKKRFCRQDLKKEFRKIEFLLTYIYIYIQSYTKSKSENHCQNNNWDTQNTKQTMYNVHTHKALSYLYLDAATDVATASIYTYIYIGICVPATPPIAAIAPLHKYGYYYSYSQCKSTHR